jgi:NADPH-dependent 2,4-dienoyl-CoA reductase/sulfur reductase-like enzyme
MNDRKRGRIVIVGGVAAGASAAAKARRTNETAEIVLFEGGPYTSFANCGLPYYVGGEIASRDDLFVADPAQFVERFLVDLRLNTRVIGVDPADRLVTFVDPAGAQGTLTYDRLILATGTVPIVPRIPGIESSNVFLCRTVPDVDAITERLKNLVGGHALVFGGGYIGIESAEQLLRRSFHVTVVEMQDQLVGPLDSEMAQPVHTVARIETNAGRAKAVLVSGRELEFDIAIIGTGVRPNVELAKAAGIKLGTTGAIAVDPHQRTSDPAIFAAGDNCEAIFLPTGSNVNIPLAGPANKQGRIAGQNAALDLAVPDAPPATRLSMGGVLGTAIVRFGDVVAGATGLTEKQAKRLGIDPLITFENGGKGMRPNLGRPTPGPAAGRSERQDARWSQSGSCAGSSWGAPPRSSTSSRAAVRRSTSMAVWSSSAARPASGNPGSCTSTGGAWKTARSSSPPRPVVSLRSARSRRSPRFSNNSGAELTIRSPTRPHPKINCSTR